MATYVRGFGIDARLVVNSSQGGLGSGSAHTFYTVPSGKILRVTNLFFGGASTGLSGGSSVVTSFTIDSIEFDSATSGGAAANGTVYSKISDLGTNIEFGPGAVLALSNTSSATNRIVYWRFNGVLYSVA